MSTRHRGLALGLLSATCFGAATVFARELARSGVDGPSVLAARFGGAALVLAVVTKLRGRSLRPAAGERVPAALLGVVGYGAVAALFFAALQRGSAGGVTVVFYAYPLIVMTLESARRRTMPGRRLATGIACAAVGTYVMVGAGGVHVSGVGVALALGAASAFALYLVVAGRFLVATPAAVRATWTAAGTAIFGVGEGLVGRGDSLPGRDIPVTALAGVATAAAFLLLFETLPRLGPARTAVVLNVEAVAAIAIGAILLGERVTVVEVLGASVVLLAVGWIARGDGYLPSASSRRSAVGLLASDLAASPEGWAEPAADETPTSSCFTLSATDQCPP